MAPYGQTQYHPILAAAERNGLAFAIHVGTEGSGTAPPPTPAGYPSTYLEWRAGFGTALQAHLLSLLCEGVFERFPGLRVVLVEGGFLWLPPLLWRLDRNWRGLRSEVPWLRRRPSEYALEHVRLTTQPMDEPDDPEQLRQLVAMLPSDRMLLYSSDYPHWDFDSPRRALSALPAALRERIFALNARELYGLGAALPA
jgi:predicted TIM-barrel fold metal-dependent hydrolase